VADSEIKINVDIDQGKRNVDQLKADIDELIKKTERLRESFKTVSGKFGEKSPQASMVKTHLGAAESNLEKKLNLHERAFDKLNRSTEKLFEKQAKEAEKLFAKANRDAERANREAEKTFNRINRAAEKAFTQVNRETQKALKVPQKSNVDQDLDRRYKREHLRYMREDMKVLSIIRNTGGAVSGVAKGVYGLSQGGGLASLFGGIETGIEKAIKVGGAFAPFMVGMSLGHGSHAVRRIGAAEEAAEDSEKVFESEASKAGRGLSFLSKAIVPVKIVAVAAGATAGLFGAGAFISEQIASGLVARNRRALGYGADIGQLTAFDKTFSRYIDTSDFASKMRDAQYDITSPAYQAMRVAVGMNPGEWDDPTMMGEGALIHIQERLQKLLGKSHGQREAFLPMAYAQGFGNLGLSADQLVGIARAPPGAMTELTKIAQGAVPGLTPSADTIKANQDYITKFGLMQAQWQTLTETLNKDIIPPFQASAKDLADFAQKQNLTSDKTLESVAAEAATLGIAEFAKGIAELLDSFKKANTLPKDTPPPEQQQAPGQPPNSILPWNWDWSKAFHILFGKDPDKTGALSTDKNTDLASANAMPVSFEDVLTGWASGNRNLPVEDKALLDWFKLLFPNVSPDSGINVGGGGIGRSGLGPGYGGRGAVATGGGYYKSPIVTIGKGESMVPGISRKEMADEIKKDFGEKGIDPNVALALAKTEGAFAHRYFGDFNVGSPGWTSGGPFQLHHAPRGDALGDQFEKETGLSWRDPKTWREQVKWVANFVAKRGSWKSDWATSMAKLHLGPEAGIGWKPTSEDSKTSAAPPKETDPHKVPKANIHIPNFYSGHESSEYPTPTEKVHGPTSLLHLNNMNNFQQDRHIRVAVNNRSGADVHVSSGMLGFGSGNYG
jgi:hypothetical protein